MCKLLANNWSHVVHEYISDPYSIPHLMQNMLTLMLEFVQICTYHPPGLMNAIHLQTGGKVLEEECGSGSPDKGRHLQ